MYQSFLKTAITEAVRSHFDIHHTEKDFKQTWVSIEYPVEEQNYPGIWINYQDTADLIRAGIDYREVLTDETGTHEVVRWRFAGKISFTCAAINSSWEKDRLVDEVIKMIAFAGFEGDVSSVFKDALERNDFIALNADFDTIEMEGDGSAPGTPWGSSEIIHEKTVSINCIGEFVSDPTTQSMAILSDIQVMGYRDGETPPRFPDIPPPDGIPDDAPPWSPLSWH